MNPQSPLSFGLPLVDGNIDLGTAAEATAYL